MLAEYLQLPGLISQPCTLKPKTNAGAPSPMVLPGAVGFLEGSWDVSRSTT